MSLDPFQYSKERSSSSWASQGGFSVLFPRYWFRNGIDLLLANNMQKKDFYVASGKGVLRNKESWWEKMFLFLLYAIMSADKGRNSFSQYVTPSRIHHVKYSDTEDLDLLLVVLSKWANPGFISSSESIIEGRWQMSFLFTHFQLHFLWPIVKSTLQDAQYQESESKSHKKCLTLCNPMDYRVHGILQARILEWVAFPFSRESSQPRDQTQVSHITGRFFTSWTTREAHIRRDPHMQPMVESSILLVGQVTKSIFRTNVEKM